MICPLRRALSYTLKVRSPIFAARPLARYPGNKTRTLRSSDRKRLRSRDLSSTYHADKKEKDMMQTPTTNPEEYDLVILGSGEAGKYTAWTLAKKGMKTVVIERKYVGGSCPNIACLPSKNIIHSAKVASLFFRSPEFGISKEQCRIDMATV